MFHAFTGYIDLAQLTLYAFWLFFAALVFYLHRENKREGYPLETERPRSARVAVRGFPEVPPLKVFRSHDGQVFTQPEYGHDRVDAPVVPGGEWPGAPFRPVGDPMLGGVGPASYAARADVPERGMTGQAILMPLRKALAHSIAPDGPNPIGMTVLGKDGEPAGTVVDIWIDEAESIIRYLEVGLLAGVGVGKRLLPMAMARVRDARRVVKVASITAGQFANVPVTKAADEITKLEEDQIVGYFAGGYLYSQPILPQPLFAKSRYPKPGPLRPGHPGSEGPASGERQAADRRPVYPEAAAAAPAMPSSSPGADR